MRHLILTTNGPDLEFHGACIAAVDSRRDAVGRRFTELRLYRRDCGSGYVAVRHVVNRQTMRHQRTTAEYCPDLEAVFRFFGGGYLSKNLYRAAGIEYVEWLP